MPSHPIPAFGSVTPDARSLAVHVPKRLLSLPEVLELLPIGRTMFCALMKHPARPFPSPLHLGRRSVWVEEEVAAWIDAQVGLKTS